LFKLLEFKRLLKDLRPEADEVKAVKVASVEDRDLAKKINKSLELIICGHDLRELVLGLGEGYFRVSEPADNLKKTLEDPRVLKIGHDLKSIKRALEQDKINLAGLYFDTMIAAYLLNPSKSSYSFNDVVADYCGVFLGDEPLEAGSPLAWLKNCG
jgi:DNA polymerase I-like protein with 3'-5' exonuclease and polymerase domains